MNPITVTEAARESGLSDRAVRKAIAAGTLAATLYGKTYLIERADFDAWLADEDAHKRGRRHAK